MKRVTFVTGPSCSGKTTVNEGLAGDESVSVFDVDEDGTPDAGALNWLAWRNEDLLYRAANWSAETGIPCVVTGIIWPHKVIESTAMFAIDPDVEIHFVMLELTKKRLTSRLRERLKHSDTPLTPLVDYNWHLQRRLLEQVTHQRNGHIIRTDKWSPEMVVDCVRLIATKD